MLYSIVVGFIEDVAVEELLRECTRMAAFNHPHVMTLRGVCLDGGPVPYIVLPYMANGSLLAYLKRERHNLVIDDNSQNEEVGTSSVQNINSHALTYSL